MNLDLTTMNIIVAWQGTSERPNPLRSLHLAEAALRQTRRAAVEPGHCIEEERTCRKKVRPCQISVALIACGWN